MSLHSTHAAPHVASKPVNSPVIDDDDDRRTPRARDWVHPRRVRDDGRDAVERARKNRTQSVGPNSDVILIVCIVVQRRARGQRGEGGDDYRTRTHPPPRGWVFRRDVPNRGDANVFEREDGVAKVDRGKPRLRDGDATTHG